MTTQDIKYYFQGKYRSLLGRYQLLPDYIREQVSWRSQQCRPCLEAGHCVVCKCETPALFFADKGCPKGRYPSMLSKEAWEKLNRI